MVEMYTNVAALQKAQFACCEQILRQKCSLLKLFDDHYFIPRTCTTGLPANCDFEHHFGVNFEINSHSLLQIARVALVFWNGRSLTTTLLFIDMLLSINFCVNNTHIDAH